MIDPAFGWGLPPGVTDRDIDEHFGDDQGETADERRQRIEEEKGEDRMERDRSE